MRFKKSAQKFWSFQFSLTFHWHVNIVSDPLPPLDLLLQKRSKCGHVHRSSDARFNFQGWIVESETSNITPHSWVLTFHIYISTPYFGTRCIHSGVCDVVNSKSLYSPPWPVWTPAPLSVETSSPVGSAPANHVKLLAVRSIPKKSLSQKKYSRFKNLSPLCALEWWAFSPARWIIELRSTSCTGALLGGASKDNGITIVRWLASGKLHSTTWPMLHGPFYYTTWQERKGPNHPISLIPYWQT